MTTDQDQDTGDDSFGDDDDEFSSATGTGQRAPRKPNPVIDTSVPLTNEGYGSREWYRYSHEANTFGRKINSRYVDQTVEFDDAQGFRYYAQQEMYVWKEEELPFREVRDSSGNKVPSLGVAWVKGKIKTLKGSDEPELGLPKRVSRGKRIWEEERDRAFKEAKGKSKEDLKPEQKLRAMRTAQARFLKKAGDAVELRRGWFLTPMRIRAMVQAPIKPWFMVPKPTLDDAYAEVERLKEQNKTENSDDPVPYLFVGCDNDEELITFIRTDEKPSDVNHKPPKPLLKAVDSFGNPSYFVQRRDEDERAMTLRAHKAAVAEVQTAEAIYKKEHETKDKTGYFDHPNFKLFPREVKRDDEAILAWLAQEVKSGREKTHDREWAIKWSGWLRDYYENWLTKRWDRWMPSECYSYRNRIYDAVAFFDPSDWSTVADRIWDVMAQEIHVITPPEVVGVYPDIMTDWRPFRDYVAPVQNRRWVVEIFNHWKMTKSTRNSLAAEDLEGSDIKVARRQSHGGPKTEEKKADDDWRYNKLRNIADAEPERALKLLGPLWIKKQRWQPIDHDGALMSKKTRKGVSLLDGLGKVRNLSSMAGGREFPEIDQLRQRFTTQVRGYRSEYHWLLNDEYTTRDPEDSWKNQSGVLPFSLLDEANLRLDGAFAHVPWLRLAYSDSPTGRAFTNLSAFIEEMWHNLPPAPIVAKVEEEIESWEHHNVEHWRPELEKLLHGVHRSKGRHGLDKYFTGYYQSRGQKDRVLDGRLGEGQQYRDLQIINRRPIMDDRHVPVRNAFERDWEWVKGWYERSDDRINDFIYWWCEAGSHDGKGGATGAGGLDVKKASDLNAHGCGLGYGTLGEQQERQERLSGIGLQVSFYSTMKHTLQWLSVRVTAIELMPDVDDYGMKVNKTWLTLNELKLKVGGLIESGKLLYFIARDDLWPRIQAMCPRVANEAFPWEHAEPAQMDDQFVMHVLDYLVGTDSRPQRKKIVTADEPLRSALIAEIAPTLKQNRERYARIVEGRFFEINHHSDA